MKKTCQVPKKAKSRTVKQNHSIHLKGFGGPQGQELGAVSKICIYRKHTHPCSKQEHTFWVLSMPAAFNPTQNVHAALNID